MHQGPPPTGAFQRLRGPQNCPRRTVELRCIYYAEKQREVGVWLRATARLGLAPCLGSLQGRKVPAVSREAEGQLVGSRCFVSLERQLQNPGVTPDLVLHCELPQAWSSLARSLSNPGAPGRFQVLFAGRGEALVSSHQHPQTTPQTEKGVHNAQT